MTGGGRGAGLKQDDFQSQPVEEQLPGVECCINSPPKWPDAFVLGFQHYLVMLGTTVLIPSIIVPQMGGAAEEKVVVIQTLQFVAGINTLIQSYFGTRLPAVIGGSFTFVVPTLSIVLANRYNFITDPHERFRQAMRGVQGANFFVFYFFDLCRWMIQMAHGGVFCLVFVLIAELM